MNTALPPASGNPSPDSPQPRPRTRRIKIGIVLDQPFPGNSRVERQAAALAEDGYEVHLLCLVDPALPDRCPREEFYQGVYIHRASPDDLHCNIMGWETRLPYQGVIKSVSRLLWNRDNEWHTLIDRFVRFYGLDILHVHELRLADTALAVTRPREIPLVLDLPENYPALTEMRLEKQNPLLARKYRDKWEEIELRGVSGADRVLIGAPEAKEHLSLNGASDRKMTIIPNWVDVEAFLHLPPSSEIIRQFKPWFLMTYVGPMQSRHCGVHTVLEALGILKPEIPELFFVACGPVREAYGLELKELMTRYELENRVLFTGTLPDTEAINYIAASDICLYPPLSSDYSNTTLPAQVSLYQLYKMPLLVSTCSPLKRHVAETQGGLEFVAGDAQDLANQIRRLYYDTELKRTLGDNGQQATLTTHNWEAIKPQFLAVYESLVTEKLPVRR